MRLRITVAKNKREEKLLQGLEYLLLIQTMEELRDQNLRYLSLQMAVDSFEIQHRTAVTNSSTNS